MAKPPKNPKDPGQTDPRQGVAAGRAAMPDALADILNPGIKRGSAGMGSGTGSGNIQPPPDNSFDRRRQFSEAHTARKSTPKDMPLGRRHRTRAVARPRTVAQDQLGFDEAPQTEFTGPPVSGLDPKLEEELGLSDALKYRLPKADLPTFGGGLASMGSRRQPASRSTGCCAKAAPNSTQQVWTPHRPPRPEKSEGGRPFVIKSDFEPAGDQPAAIKDLVEGVQAQRPHAGAARRHRLRQDLHHGQGDRGDAAPRADPRAEQDARRAALRRVQVLLPRQRGRVFRLLLRLLPAGSLRPAHRHLHREGILDQRADRPHAPLGDARAARARRRHHRRLGVVHLRYRLGRDLFGDDLHDQAGRQDRPAPAARRPRRAAIQAHAARFRPRLVPRARRHHRDLPGAL